MQQSKQHGGARPGAGRAHEHQQYLMVEVVNFYGNKDVLLAGPILNNNGAPSRTIEARANSIAAHHIEENAQSVRILKRWCCIPQDSELICTIK